MLIIRNFNDFEKYKNSIPEIILSNVAGEIYLFESMLNREYYDKDLIDEYGPEVLIIDRNEFENINKQKPLIKPNEYEYKEFVGLTKTHYFVKYCYLLNNGESGFLVYVINKLLNLSGYANSYITSHAKEVLSDSIIAEILSIIEKTKMILNKDFDYLQVFDLKRLSNDIIKIHHYQEEPEFSRIYYLNDSTCIECKLFWISEKDENNEEYSTLMLAEDY